MELAKSYGKQDKMKNSSQMWGRKLKYNKAIRDKIPGIIKDSGYSCRVIKLSNKKFLSQMEKKLLEETKEYLRDKQSDELADILEVIYRIAELKGVSTRELEKIRSKKKEKRGGFKKNFFLINTTKSL